jgi:putative transposase
MRPHVWNLRSGRSFRRLRGAFSKGRDRLGLRLIEFSVQGNHLHLIVEADSSAALSRGMQGLAIRIARALNALMHRAGSVLADHYHSRLLGTPTELVRAIRYVIGNHEHHFAERGMDPFSSASLPAALRGTLLATPLGWLLRKGFRRARLC